MATHTEMSRTAANPALVHQMAAFLLSLQDADWTDWEQDFLEDMRRYSRAEPLRSRACRLNSALKSLLGAYSNCARAAVSV